MGASGGVRLDAISIHALHEESDVFVCTVGGISLIISIHALHEESDPINRFTENSTGRFQSTLSMRRATRSFFRAVSS